MCVFAMAGEKRTCLAAGAGGGKTGIPQVGLTVIPLYAVTAVTRPPISGLPTTVSPLLLRCVSVMWGVSLPGRHSKVTPGFHSCSAVVISAGCERLWLQAVLAQRKRPARAETVADLGPESRELDTGLVHTGGVGGQLRVLGELHISSGSR